MKKGILLVVTVLFIGSSLFAQTLTGTWKGNIDLNGTQLPIVFHFTKGNNGQMDGKWDSPKQNVVGLPFSAINANADSVRLGIKMINGSYEGKFIGEDSIAGTWSQNGAQLPLNFSRTNGNVETQNEIPAHPGEKEIEITSAVGSKLYGTLLSKNKQQPLAIIIAGSGPTDRNGNNTHQRSNQ